MSPSPPETAPIYQRLWFLLFTGTLCVLGGSLWIAKSWIDSSSHGVGWLLGPDIALALALIVFGVLQCGGRASLSPLPRRDRRGK